MDHVAVRLDQDMRRLEQGRPAKPVRCGFIGSAQGCFIDRGRCKGAFEQLPDQRLLVDLPFSFFQFDRFRREAARPCLLQQNLAQARQELSTALYQNDAAARVIARLTQERDAATEALKTVNVASSGTTTNGDVMHVDSAPLPDNIVAKIDTTQQG